MLYIYKMSKEIRSILLVDDDPDDRLLFEEALSKANDAVELHMAIDGIDALEKLQTRNDHFPDLIFMDVNMPRMDGISCLKEIKKTLDFDKIPILMYSTSSYYRNECMSLGAIDYIEKPTDFQKLCDKIKTIINTDYFLPA